MDNESSDLMDKKIPIIAVVVVIIIIAAALVPYLTKDDSDDEKQEKTYVEYDASKGWASWNPTVSVIDSSKLSGSPYLAITLQEQVENFYNVKVEQKYTIDDVPKDFLAYDSLVSHDSSGNLVIKSFAKGTNGDYESRDITFTSTPDYYMTTGSFIVTMYYILCEAYGTEYSDFDSKVLEKLWSMVYATDNAGYARITGNYGIPATLFDGVKLNSSTDTQGNKEQYISILESVKSEGKTICYMASGSMTSWANGNATWITDTCQEAGSYATIFNITHLYNVVAEVEAIAYIMGYGDKAQDIVDNMRVSLYNTYMCGQEQAAKLPYQYSAVCTYITNDYTFGSDSIAQEIFDFMGLKNIKTDSSGNWSQEKVVDAQPEYLLMVGKEPIDWNQLYRVNN